jgi:glycosyltransferase involved in cell wall biosynthesis
MRSNAPSPTVGIGMPVFNGERYLAEAVSSVLDQTFNDLELVICDNASTDGTAEICRRFVAQDARVRYFRQPENLGAHPNYNRSFELSRGRYFKWAAHDDVLKPEFLQACVGALEHNTDAVLCQSDIDYIDENGHSIGARRSHLHGAESDDPSTRFKALVLRAHDCQAMMGVFRRAALEQSMLLPSFHGADRALLAQIALFGRYIHVPGALIQVRDHGDRYSRSRKRPADRAAWHDTRNRAKHGFPVWRTYRTYWQSIAQAPISASARARSRTGLFEWWFRNYNAARMVVDLLGHFAPGIVGPAERFKQNVFSPAPGAGEVRRGDRR